MLNSKHQLFSAMVAVSLFLPSMSASAFTITKTRLFLDPKANTTSMSVINSESKPLNCRVNVRNLDIENGNLVVKDKEESANPSPENLIRLAPKRFKLGVRASQEFKVIYRRKPNQAEGEYIGAVAIRCSSPTEQQAKQVNIEPSLVHNVPIVVRTKKFDSAVELSNATKVANAVEAEVLVTGDRSVTGHIRLSNADTGSVVSEIRRWSHYPGQARKKIRLNLPENAGSNPLKVSFSEIEESGKVTAETRVK